jgi:hypothetical protein
LDDIIFGVWVIWLGIVSWFDLKKQEVPHIAWMVIPFVCAILYRLFQGSWQLILITLLVATVSERERISQKVGLEEIRYLIIWFPLLFLGAFISMQASPITALAILGFWVAWELKWWGGADAILAISVGLFWPGLHFILAFLISHLLVAVAISSWTLIKERRLKFHKIPGLPILLASVLLLKVTPSLFR